MIRICRWCSGEIPIAASRGMARKYCSAECKAKGVQKYRRIINAKWQARNPEAHRATASKWAANNPKKLLATRLKKYGLSPIEFEAMRVRQNDTCLICPERTPLVVDHCHRTGVVRGLLCNRCNLMMGGFQDNPELLRKAANYLEVATSVAPIHQ